MYQDVFDALAKLGLKRDEAKVYLACLRNQSGLFVHEITKTTGIKRSTVDLILARLVSKNILNIFREGRRRKFMAEMPERLFFNFQQSLDDFRSLIPLLMRMGGGAEQTRVTFYEGAKGVQAVYNDIILSLQNLPEKERILLCVSSGRDVERVQPRFRKQFIDLRVKNRIHVEMIAVRDDPAQTWPSSHEELRVTKMFDGKKYPFKIEVNFYADKIFFMSAHKPIGGIIIESQIIASSMKSLFRLIWDGLGSIEPFVESKK
jgi:sugar-specific transcriptional regulator TrmB